MTDELPPDIRALLADSRAQLGPDGAAIARLRMRVAAGVGKGVVGATFVKVVLLGVAVASTGAIAYALRRAPETTATTAPVIDVAGSASSADEALRVHAIEHEADAPSAAAVDERGAARAGGVAKRAIIVEPLPPPAPAPTPDVTPAPATPAAHLALSREIQLVDDATRALHRADFARAIAIVHTYDAETAGTGQLAEDAAAISIEAACGQHADVTARLATFDQRWPRSAQRARITAACLPGASR